MSEKRDILVKLAYHDLNIWYKWGGDDPSGMDCSGWVIEKLISIGLLPEDYDNTAQGLKDYFKDCEIDMPYKGCLVFYGKPRIYHVEICITHDLSIGASGGGRRQKKNIQTIQDLFEWWKTAVEDNAYIKMRPVKKKDKEINCYVDPFLILANG